MVRAPRPSAPPGPRSSQRLRPDDRPQGVRAPRTSPSSTTRGRAPTTRSAGRVRPALQVPERAAGRRPSRTGRPSSRPPDSTRPHVRPRRRQSAQRTAVLTSPRRIPAMKSSSAITASRRPQASPRRPTPTATLKFRKRYWASLDRTQWRDIVDVRHELLDAGYQLLDHRAVVGFLCKAKKRRPAIEYRVVCGRGRDPTLRTVMDIKLSTAPACSPFSTVSGAWHVAR